MWGTVSDRRRARLGVPCSLSCAASRPSWHASKGSGRSACSLLCRSYRGPPKLRSDPFEVTAGIALERTGYTLPLNDDLLTDRERIRGP
jgi:hypothetical protein